MGVTKPQKRNSDINQNHSKALDNTGVNTGGNSSTTEQSKSTASGKKLDKDTVDKLPDIIKEKTPEEPFSNEIEWFFGVIGRHLLKKGNYTSVEDLEESIRRYLKQHNELSAHPYGWDVDIDSLIQKVSKQIVHEESTVKALDEAI